MNTPNNRRRLVAALMPSTNMQNKMTTTTTTTTTRSKFLLSGHCSDSYATSACSKSTTATRRKGRRRRISCCCCCLRNINANQEEIMILNAARTTRLVALFNPTQSVLRTTLFVVLFLVSTLITTTTTAIAAADDLLSAGSAQESILGAPLQQQASLLQDGGSVNPFANYQTLATTTTTNAQQTNNNNNPKQQKQVELLVQPNAPVRIECKLPPLVAQSNKTRTFYWNFQRTSVQDTKPDLLSYGTELISSTHGIELDYDQASGAYDLVIQNTTYELNDGVYYCDFRDTAPETRQTINREIRLTVLIPPQAPTIAPLTQLPAREGLEYQLSCVSHGGNPEPNITWFRNEQLLSSGAGVRVEQSRQNGTTASVITWLPTMDDHQATFKCSVSNKAMANGQAPLERDLTLPVEYAPRISVGPFNPLKVIQGERATLTCQVDANPPVKGIRWLKEGRLISNQYNHTIHELKISDASVYACQADNGIAPVLLTTSSGQPLVATSSAAAANVLPSSSANSQQNGFFAFLGLASGPQQQQQFNNAQDASGQQISKTLVEARLQLEVLYAPRVQIRESRVQPVNENDSFTLNCTVDAWPPAHEFVWTKQEDATTFRRLSASSSPTLEFQMASPSDMGNYTCTAYNRLEPSHVNHGVAPLVFERQASASFMVLVRHKPGLAELVLGQQGETELGNKTLLHCKTRPLGYPEPKYTFWRLSSSAAMNGANTGSQNRHAINRVQDQGPTYTLFAAKPEDEGRYSCQASNELGRSTEAVGELLVNEPPQIVHDKTWRSEDSRSPGDSPYSITVRANGKPEPKVSWFHRSPIDGRRIDLSSPEMRARYRIETHVQAAPAPSRQSSLAAAAATNALHHTKTTTPHKYLVVSTLTFRRPLEVDDRGLYTVEFSNGLSRMASESHQLHVHHAPVPALLGMPVGKPQTQLQLTAGGGVHAKTRAGFNMNELANLTCRVSAHPQPQFMWYSQGPDMTGKSLESNARYQFNVANVRDDIWEGSVSFEVQSESDYGDYLCATANQLGATQQVSDSIKMLINLGRKSTPEPPLLVEQIDASQDSVTLQWLAGFDGGLAPDRYEIQYAPSGGEFTLGGGVAQPSRNAQYAPDSSQASMQSSAADNAADLLADQQQPFPRLFQCLTRNPCTVTHLQARQTYLMRVRAHNELGHSDFSDELRVSTRATNVTSQLPRIQEAHFDGTRNILHFRIEPSPEYLLNTLEVKIDVRGTSQVDQQQQQHHTIESGEQWAASEWRRHSSVPLRQEIGEAYLNMAPDSEQLRLQLCSRLNDTQCGPELVVGAHDMGGLASSFLHDQRGLSISILASTLVLIAVLGGFATTLHSCCVSRKAKKAAALDGQNTLNGHHYQSSGNDNKPIGSSGGGHVNGGLSLANGSSVTSVTQRGGGGGGSHGSTASTNSTSATGGQQQLQSMDSIHNHGAHAALGGGTSDHSSDHSRQAKLDSMLPPNYSHYADRASLMLEQQQQQQQAYLHDKLGSPFGLPTSALMTTPSAATTSGMHHQQEIPMQMGDYFDGAYGVPPANMMDANGMLAYEPHPADGQMHHSVYRNGHHQSLVDEYSYNNALAFQQQQHEQQQQLIESAYGTTGSAVATSAAGLMMAQPTQASYDNNANQSYVHSSYANHHSYDPQQQQQQVDSQQQQYQHDLAAAQQQMYGTLARTSNGYQTTDQQVSAEQYASSTATGLSMPQPPPPPPPPPPPQESDYGTTGARSSGRLIREIIV